MLLGVPGAVNTNNLSVVIKSHDISCQPLSSVVHGYKVAKCETMMCILRSNARLAIASALCICTQYTSHSNIPARGATNEAASGAVGLI